MNIYEKYLMKVKFRLHVDRETKKRIIDGLRTDMEYAIENGETSDELFRRMGSPEEMAESFNSTYQKDPDYQKRKRYRIAKVITFTSLGISVILVLAVIMVGVNLRGNYSISPIGGVSGPTNIETVSTPVTLLDVIKPISKYVTIFMIVFVLSAAYCIKEKFRQKGNKI